MKAAWSPASADRNDCPPVTARQVGLSGSHLEGTVCEWVGKARERGRVGRPIATTALSPSYPWVHTAMPSNRIRIRRRGRRVLTTLASALVVLPLGASRLGAQIASLGTPVYPATVTLGQSFNIDISAQNASAVAAPVGFISVGF